MSVPMDMSLAIIVYGLSCARAWRRIVKEDTIER